MSNETKTNVAQDMPRLKFRYYYDWQYAVGPGTMLVERLRAVGKRTVLLMVLFTGLVLWPAVNLVAGTGVTLVAVNMMASTIRQSMGIEAKEEQISSNENAKRTLAGLDFDSFVANRRNDGFSPRPPAVPASGPTA